MPPTQHPPAAAAVLPRWDIFCRVIDNFGDVGVCWRLAADLSQRGLQVRLFIDDARALAWMAPAVHPGVAVQAWPCDSSAPPAPGVADVVIEAFGCDPPRAYTQAMAARADANTGAGTDANASAGTDAAPVWINLEYLSAEGYVERSHGLPSPQRSGLTKWFFYPGYTPRTGGLLREPDLPARQAAFNRSAWLARQGISLQPGERLVSLFCYANPRLPALVHTLAQAPTCLLLTPGPAQAALEGLAPQHAGKLRLLSLPWQTQTAYDEMLWACDMNFVRGEDSLVRALWARQPLVWQAYPQHDGAHHAKVQALLQQAGLGHGVHALWHWWNGSAATPENLTAPAVEALHSPAAWQPALSAWLDQLQQLPPLAEQLMAFALKRSSLSTGSAALRTTLGEKSH